ncbi:MAG: TolC family protein [Bacteroidota bacterium]|nr:TolC family protein [Bacteroidota bacterium]
MNKIIQENILKIKCIIILLSFFLITATIIKAQENVARKINLQTAIELALEQNKALNISKLEVDKTHSKLTEARSNLLPKINASGQYTNNIKKPVIFLPPGTPFSRPGQPAIMEIGSDHSYSGIISASLPVFSYPIYIGMSMANTGKDLAEETFRGTKFKTIADVKKSFYGVLLSREVKNLMIASLKNANDNFENVRKMQKQGLVSEYDLIRAEVQVENVKPIALQAENNYELAKNSFKIALGLDASVNIDIDGELDYKQTETPNFTRTVEVLDQNNSDIKQLQYHVDIAKSMINLERSGHLPTLAAFGNYQYQTQANDLKFKDYNWVNTQFVGLQLQIPIFNGWGTQAKIDQAKISYQQLLDRQNLLTEAVKIQAQNVIYRIEQGKKRIDGQDKAIAQAERGFEIAKSRYSNGLGTQLEVNDAELALTQSKVNYFQAVYDYNSAVAELEQLLGNNF